MKTRTNFIAIASAGASLIAMLSASTPAFAQDNAPAAAEEASAADIIVTGTRITRSGFAAPTPLTVIGTEEIQARAPVNIANYVNELPQLSASVTPGTTLVGVGGGTGGANILNLRGLGINRTLVLLNGNRVVSSTTTGGVDVNMMPQGLISRVDVVTGGASAAWGSDAVAGVVNFVLNTKYEGFKFNVQAGSSTRGDAGNVTGSATFGTSFADGRGHFVVDVSGSIQRGIDSYASRGWYKGYRLLNNPAFAAGNGQPQQIVAPADFLVASPGGIIISGARALTTQFDANGQPIPFDRGAPSSPFKIGGSPNDVSAGYVLLVPVKYGNVFSRLSYDLTDDVSVYAEGSYAASHTQNESVAFPTLGTLVIQPDNAYLPAALAGTGPFALGKFFNILGEPVARNDREVIRGLVGAEGGFGDGWTWKAYYQHGEAKILNQVSNDPIVANVLRSADAVRNGAGQIVCRSTLTAPANGCVPLNPFGTAPVSQAVIDYVTGLSIQHTKLKQNVAAATINGEPFSIWAGPVSVAAGVEYRTESYSADADARSQASAFWIGNYKPGRGKYNVKEAFAEVVVPLLKDLPFAQSLDLNLAGRITDYSVSGTVKTYKAGLTWDVNNAIRFRGTHSRDIRAPNLQDLFLGGQVNTQIVADPFRNNAQTTFTQVLSGNTNLTPEIANADTFGVILKPSFVPGLNFSVDYYRTKIKDAIISLGSQQVVNNCFAGETGTCAAIVRDAAGVITQINISGFNASSEKLSGIDYELSYVRDLGDVSSSLAGKLMLRALVTQTLKRSITANGVTTNYLGMTASQAPGAYPAKWRWYGTVGYDIGASRTVLTMRGLGKGVYDNRWTSGVQIDNNRVKGATYFDLSQTFKIEVGGHKAEFFGVIENLFDKDPPVAASTSFLYPGTNPTYFDTIGRRFRVGFRAEY